jgi:hypothetical protein
MATIYADAQGVILHLATPELPGYIPTPPTNAPNVLEFDEESNPAVLSGLIATPASWRLLAGVLTRDGVAVTLAQSRAYRDKQFALEKLAELEADGVLSDAHQDRVLRFVLRWIVRQG